jgi:bile acid:Na+ symporter, BASS family
MDIAILTKVLSAALAIIMLGLGLHLTIADFARVVRYPKAAFIGLFCQAIILPAGAFALCKLFALPAPLAVGVMLLSASPGGVTANLYSHLFKGDVALNITLTAVNSLISLVTLPLIVGFSISHFLAANQQIPLPTAKIIQVFAVVLLPVSIGMLIRNYAQSVAARLERPVKILSVIALVLAVVVSVVDQRQSLLNNFKSVGAVMILFNVMSLVIGYIAPRLAGIGQAQSIAVGMEIGIHNGTLAIAIATTVLLSTEMAMPAAIYSILMFFTAAIFGYIVTRKPKLRA